MTPDDPRHGRNAGYAAGCREQCCRDAAARYVRGLEWDWMQGKRRTVPVLGARRRIEALQALGWSREYLSERLGYSRAWLYVTLYQNNGGRIYRRNFDQIVALYDELCMTLPPETRCTGRQRAQARRKGYVPPLAWEDVDDPNERPRTTTLRHIPKHDLDPVVVERVLAGDKLPMTTAERREVVSRARALGWSYLQIEARTGITKSERIAAGLLGVAS